MATVPANAVTGKNAAVNLEAISCASPGNCTAIGWYYDNAINQQGLLLTEKAGHWAPGVEAPLPADATSNPDVRLWSVSCASAGNCSAVGEYLSTDGPGGLLLTETAGHWAPGVEGEPATSVSCSSPGNCTAVGGGVLITQKAGRWAKAVSPPLPADARAEPWLLFGTVSCVADGRCSAAGTYNIRESRVAAAGEGVLLTEKKGTWRAVKAVMPSDGPGEGVLLGSVSCSSGGNCAAVGRYNINIDSEGGSETVVLTETAGKWRRGVELSVNDLSCPSRGNCVAVSRGRFGRVSLLTEEAGKWRRGVAAVLPRRFRRTYASRISCASPGNCVVIGSYSDGNDRQHGFLLTETAGKWARGVKALPRNTELDSVSCASRGGCGAVGAVNNGVSVDGVLLDSSR